MNNKKSLIILVVLTLIIISIFCITNINISFLDIWFYNKVASKITPNLTMIMKVITECGGTIALIILCFILFITRKTRKTWCIPVTLSLAVSSFVNLLLKFIVGRERPNILRLVDANYYSFPSGHAMNNMAFYTMILLLTLKHVKNKSLKYIISSICIILPILIGFSRIYIGVHYTTDVLAGWLLGILIALIIFKIYNLKKEEV